MLRPMRVVPVPCLSDNYAYLVTADGADEAVVVDPSEAGPGDRGARARGAPARGDPQHAPPLRSRRRQRGAPRSASAKLPVFAHESESGRVPAQTEQRRRGRAASRSPGSTFDALHVPGHTLGAVAYVRRRRGVHRRHAVRRRVRPPVRGDARRRCTRRSADKLGKLPPDDARLLRARVHRVNNLRFARHGRAGQPRRRRRSSARARPRASAASRRCRRRSARSSRPIRSCACAEPAVRARFPGETRPSGLRRGARSQGRLP